MPSSGSVPRQTLPARLRVKRAALFQEAYAQGDRHTGRHLILWQRRGEGACARVGVVASRKVGDSVTRSRAKRRLRELYRRNRHRLVGEADLILVARHTLPFAPWSELQSDFESVLRHAGRLTDPTAAEGCNPPSMR